MWPGNADLLAEVWQRSEFGFRRGPSRVLLAVGVVGGARIPWKSGWNPMQSKSVAKSGSHRSPDKAYRQLRLRTEPGSHRSPGGVNLRSELSAESGSRRSPDEVCLAAVGVEDEARLL